MNQFTDGTIRRSIAEMHHNGKPVSAVLTPLPSKENVLIYQSGNDITPIKMVSPGNTCCIGDMTPSFWRYWRLECGYHQSLVRVRFLYNGRMRA